MSFRVLSLVHCLDETGGLDHEPATGFVVQQGRRSMH